MSLDYELSPIGKYRKGTSDDPYMPINQQQKIINQRMQLTEIPVFRDKVRIYGYSEVPQHASGDLTSTQYRVDYNNGIVYFHKDAEGKTLTASFLGRGNAYISSNRVWVDQNNGEVTRTLKDLIDTGETALDNIQKLNQVINDAKIATNNANEATKNTNDTNTEIRNEESLRVTEESIRQENEKQRIESEQKRNQAELIRDKDENVRNSQEDERKANEEFREKSELARETNENERKSEEEKRNSNEIIRQSQEDKRQSDTVHAISEANDARDSANQAANNAQNIADETRHFDEYSPTTTYKPNNIVSFDGSSYMNVEESKGIDPSDNTKWKLVGQKGDSINWKGDYSNTTQYQKNDTVFFNGSSYISLRDTIGTSPTDKSAWGICAQKGLDGTGAGTVTEVKSINDDIKVEFESTTPTLSLNSGNGANQIVKRDINGKIEDVENHVTEYVAHGATNEIQPNRIILRDPEGRAKVAPPIEEEHIARKFEVDRALKEAKDYFDDSAQITRYQDIELKLGIQNLDVPDTAPFRLGEIRGRTLINLLGVAGACEDINQMYYTVSLNLESDSATKIQGNGSTKMSLKSGNNIGSMYKPLDTNSIKGKNFVCVADVKNGTCNVIRLCLWNGATNIYQTKSESTSNEFNTVILLISASDIGDSINNLQVTIEGAEGQYAWADSIRMYEITEDEYNVIGSMIVEDVATRYPYVDAMTNVTNPYAVATSGNLLPPFTEWDLRKTDSIVSSYELTKVATAQYDATISPKIRVIRGQTYTLSGARNGRMVLGEYKEDGTVLGYPIAEDKDNNGYFTKTVTIGSDTDYVIVQLSNMATSGTFSFSNTTLTPTATPQPFTPQSRSMWTAECQLAANPVDGSNADVLYVGDDGLPYVLEKWGKEALAERQQWGFVATYTGFKQVGGQTYKYPITGHQGLVVKYDGKMLTNFVGIPSSADMGTISQNTGEIHITIANADSGWGDSYTPTADEIKAYFLGWKMYDGVNGKNPYTSGTRAWCYRESTDSYTGGTNTLPTTMAPNWTPYRLQHLKSKPTVEPVSNYETGLTLGKGWNIIEVGSGIVIREKANPYPNGDGTYSINTLSNPTKYRVDSISSMFRNNMRDVTYSLERREPGSEYVSRLGLGFAKTSLFDPTAVYHVTYTMLDPTLTATISGSIAANLRGTVTDVVQWASDAERRLNVVETKKAEKDAPQWIFPSLLNGWQNNLVVPIRYRKVGNIVYVAGRISGGTIGVGKPAFILPKGYRPRYPMYFTINDATADSRYVAITTGGQIEIEGGLSGDLNLDGIVYEAEQ